MRPREQARWMASALFSAFSLSMLPAFEWQDEHKNTLKKYRVQVAPQLVELFGDAEWIGVFTAAENQGRLGLEAQGSIDVPVIRDQVASILEGGRDAFIQRKEKYEF